MFEHSSPLPAVENMSPFASPSAGTAVWQQPNILPSRTADEKRYKFLRRFIHFRHMDFEYALWQMLHLFISPQKVYVLKCFNSLPTVLVLGQTPAGGIVIKNKVFTAFIFRLSIIR